MTIKSTYRDRFSEALGNLTFTTCPDNLIDEWINGESDEFASVACGIMKKGMGYIHPEGLLEFAKQIRNFEYNLQDDPTPPSEEV